MGLSPLEEEALGAVHQAFEQIFPFGPWLQCLKPPRIYLCSRLGHIEQFFEDRSLMGAWQYLTPVLDLPGLEGVVQDTPDRGDRE